MKIMLQYCQNLWHKKLQQIVSKPSTKLATILTLFIASATSITWYTKVLDRNINSRNNNIKNNNKRSTRKQQQQQQQHEEKKYHHHHHPSDECH